MGMGKSLTENNLHWSSMLLTRTSRGQRPVRCIMPSTMLVRAFPAPLGVYLRCYQLQSRFKLPSLSFTQNCMMTHCCFLATIVLRFLKTMLLTLLYLMIESPTSSTFKSLTAPSWTRRPYGFSGLLCAGYHEHGLFHAQNDHAWFSSSNNDVLGSTSTVVYLSYPFCLLYDFIHFFAQSTIICLRTLFTVDNDLLYV